MKINYLFDFFISINLFIFGQGLDLLSVPVKTLSSFIVFVFCLPLILLEYGLILLLHHSNMENRCTVYTFQQFLQPARLNWRRVLQI